MINTLTLLGKGFQTLEQSRMSLRVRAGNGQHITPKTIIYMIVASIFCFVIGRQKKNMRRRYKYHCSNNVFVTKTIFEETLLNHNILQKNETSTAHFSHFLCKYFILMMQIKKVNGCKAEQSSLKCITNKCAQQFGALVGSRRPKRVPTTAATEMTMRAERINNGARSGQHSSATRCAAIAEYMYIHTGSAEIEA